MSDLNDIIAAVNDNIDEKKILKINKKEAFKEGKLLYPIIIDMYCESIPIIIQNIPYIGGIYEIDVEGLKKDFYSDAVYCENLAIKIGTKVIEQFGNNEVGLVRLGADAGIHTWNNIKKKEKKVKEEIDDDEN